jgi:hypothetical protein
LEATFRTIVLLVFRRLARYMGSTLPGIDVNRYAYVLTDPVRVRPKRA